MPPLPAPPAAYLTARARNAMRRGPLMAIVGLLVFVAALLALTILPRGAEERARVALRRAGAPVDTVSLVEEVRTGRQVATEAERVLADARLRARARAERQAAMDSSSAAGGGAAAVATGGLRRDSVAMVASMLDQLIARAEAAPLPTSYRAIAESWALRGNARAASLLDSLTVLERERESFDASGSTDPAYVAITTRVNDIGRSLVLLAIARRSDARAALAAMAAMASARAVVEEPVDDTTPRRLEAARAREALAQVEGALSRARAHNRVYAVQAAEARRIANAAAPPPARLAAALVLGVVVAFWFSFGAELRRPRVAGAAEAARVTGVRVLAEITPPEPDDERTRRTADRDTAPLLDPTYDRYRMLYLQVSATGAAIPLVTVTGDEPEVTAVVAANIAAASGFEARATLVIDGDMEHGLVARVLRIPREPGIAAILAGAEEWARAIVSTPVGRNRYLDAIPAGRAPAAGVDPVAAQRVRRDLARYAARYDLCVLAAPPDLPEQGDRALLPTPDVILCAREGHTTLARLAEMADALRGAGTRLRGVVVWRAALPRLEGRGVEDLEARREMSWTETREAVARR